jgi:DNA-binding MarR family transcriptional regulator
MKVTQPDANCANIEKSGMMKSVICRQEKMLKEEKRALFVVDLKETDARTFILFIQTAELVLKYSEAALNKAGLSLVKLMVLQMLVSHGGSLPPSKIARLIYREKHDITTLIRRLEKDHLVKIERNTKDRRSIDVTVTGKGRQVLIEIGPVSRNIMKQVMAAIPDSSLGVLEGLLKLLRQNAADALERLTQD